MMKEANIHSQVTSTIAGDDGEAMAKSEGYVAANGFVASRTVLITCFSPLLIQQVGTVS